MENINIKELLKSNVVAFTYIKKDGTERLSLGTTKEDIIKNFYISKKQEKIEKFLLDIVGNIGKDIYENGNTISANTKGLVRDIDDFYINDNKVIHTTPDNIVNYFDLGVMGFRRFTLDNLKDIKYTF